MFIYLPENFHLWRKDATSLAAFVRIYGSTVNTKTHVFGIKAVVQTAILADLHFSFRFPS